MNVLVDLMGLAVDLQKYKMDIAAGIIKETDQCLHTEKDKKIFNLFLIFFQCMMQESTC